MENHMMIGKVYKEVKEVMRQLELLDNLPAEIQYTINQLADDNYNCEIDLKNGFNEDTVSKEAYGIVVLLYLTYISKDKQEQEDIKQIILRNKD